MGFPVRSAFPGSASGNLLSRRASLHRLAAESPSPNRPCSAFEFGLEEWEPDLFVEPEAADILTAIADLPTVTPGVEIEVGVLHWSFFRTRDHPSRRQFRRGSSRSFRRHLRAQLEAAIRSWARRADRVSSAGYPVISNDPRGELVGGHPSQIVNIIEGSYNRSSLSRLRAHTTAVDRLSRCRRATGCVGYSGQC